MKRSRAWSWLILCGSLAFSALCAVAAEQESATAAAEAKAVQEKIEKMSGKDLYRTYCKSCHGPESPHGEYAPLDLIQEQWERFFTDQYLEIHKELADTNHAGQPVIEVITPKMLEKIKDFCIEGAADSEHPMTCG